MGNFNNFGFELVNVHNEIDSIEDISFEYVKNIIDYICINGINYSDTTTLTIDLNRIYTDVPISVCKDLVNKILQIRNICSNWMNKFSTIDVVNGVEILNETIPSNIEDLKTSVYYTCSIHFDAINGIFISINIEQLRPLIYYIVECAILYSKKDGTGDWDFYSKNIVKNFNFEENQNQINK